MTKQANIAALAAKLKGIVASAVSPRALTYAKTMGGAAAGQATDIVGKAVGLHPKGPSLLGIAASPFRDAKRVLTSGKALGIGPAELAGSNPELMGRLAGTTGVGAGVGGGALAMFGPEKSAAFMEGFIEQCRGMRVSPCHLIKAAQSMPVPGAEAAERKRRLANGAAALNSGDFASRIRAAAGGSDPYAGLDAGARIGNRLRDWWFNNTSNTNVGRWLRGNDEVDADIIARQAAAAQAVNARNARTEALLKARAAAIKGTPANVGSAYSPYPSPGAMQRMTPWTMAGNALYATTGPAPVTSPVGFPAPTPVPPQGGMPAPQAAPAPALPSSPAAPAKPMAPAPVPGPATKALAFGQQAAAKTTPSAGLRTMMQRSPMPKLMGSALV